jgi:type I restriction enzyme R subunit
MSNRPEIPKAVKEELLFEVRHRYAVDCEPVSLEMAHIIPWCKTQDNSPANLIVLCANCHTRCDAGKWSESELRKYKQHPCALERDRMPPMTAAQKAMVDFILSVHPDSMTEKERLRFASMTAAYAGVIYSEVKVISVTTTNSCRVRLELPRRGAEALIEGYQSRDPRLFSFLAEVGGESTVMRIEAAAPERAVVASRTDVSEKGLETLIVSNMVAGCTSASDGLAPKERTSAYSGTQRVAQFRAHLNFT